MEKPELVLKAWSYLSGDEKPGGGALLGTENPGGAEILVLVTPLTKKTNKQMKFSEHKETKYNTIYPNLTMILWKKDLKDCIQERA